MTGKACGASALGLQGRMSIIQRGIVELDLCRVPTTLPVLFPCCLFQEMQLPTEGEGKGSFPSFLVGLVLLISPLNQALF